MVERRPVWYSHLGFNLAEHLGPMLLPGISGTELEPAAPTEGPNDEDARCRCANVHRQNILGLMVSRQAYFTGKAAEPSSRRSSMRAYNCWQGVLQRCLNPKNVGYRNYGGRGITVCKDWGSFERFLADVGPPPSDRHSLDRIDNNGNYEPGNVRWATAAEQSVNRRSNRFVTAFGKTQTVTEWARENGVSRITIGFRLERGWPPEKAVSKKPMPCGARVAPKRVDGPRWHAYLKDTMPNTAQRALAEAAKIAGSPAALARAIGVSRQRVHAWLHVNNRLGCSPDYAIRVEEATGVSRHRLCPDVFGEKS